MDSAAVKERYSFLRSTAPVCRAWSFPSQLLLAREVELFSKRAARGLLAWIRDKKMVTRRLAPLRSVRGLTAAAILKASRGLHELLLEYTFIEASELFASNLSGKQPYYHETWSLLSGAMVHRPHLAPSRLLHLSRIYSRASSPIPLPMRLPTPPPYTPLQLFSALHLPLRRPPVNDHLAPPLDPLASHASVRKLHLQRPPPPSPPPRTEPSLSLNLKRRPVIPPLPPLPRAMPSPPPIQQSSLLTSSQSCCPTEPCPTPASCRSPRAVRGSVS